MFTKVANDGLRRHERQVIACMLQHSPGRLVDACSNLCYLSQQSPFSHDSGNGYKQLYVYYENGDELPGQTIVRLQVT